MKCDKQVNNTDYQIFAKHSEGVKRAMIRTMNKLSKKQMHLMQIQ